MPLSLVKKSWPGLAALLLMGGAVMGMLPGMVVALDDDFWYLRSVIKTFQKGRPWTDDWLTPWAASSSSVSALLFQLTGSFKMAIHLQLAAAAGLAAMAATLFLKRQSISLLVALLTPLCLLAVPTVLFMFLMFTGVALYMACLWWCLLLADRKQWLWFLLPWGLAVASRQSAIAWLALPGWALITEGWAARSWRPWTANSKRLLTVFLAAGILILSLKLGMNPTEGQKLVLGGLGSAGSALVSSQGGIPMALGVLAWLGGLSLAGLIRLPGLVEKLPAGSGRWRLAAAPFLAATGAWGALWFRSHTLNTHDCYADDFSAWMIPALGAVLGACLALAGSRPRVDATLAALGAILLVALYGGRFDYYFNDALFFGLAAGFPLWKALPPVPPIATGGHSWTGRAALAGVILTFSATLLWHGRSALRLTAQQERTAALTMIYEKAMRSGILAPQHVGMASFGYLGWLFQDYYAAHDGKVQPLLGGFSRYAQNYDGTHGTGIITTFPKALRPWRNVIPTRNRASLRDTPDVPTLMELEIPLFGRFPVRYALKRSTSPDPVPGSLVVDPARYQRVPFPLNDEEWRQLILTSPPLP